VAILGGGPPVLPLNQLFEGISSRPGDPANWWVYALLLSTLIHSVANLLVGAASLTRGLPISALLAQKLPTGRAVPKFDRAWIAVAPTAQWAVGGLVVLAAFALLGWLVSWLVPDIGTWFLDYARWLAALHLPRRAWPLIP
jgi:hypothetical protein